MAWQIDEGRVDDLMRGHIKEAIGFYEEREAMVLRILGRDGYDPDQIKSAQTSCGALVGNSVMRALRSLVISELIEAADRKGADMTTTLAANIIRKTLGRGVDSRTLLKLFATRGRTARDKTENRVADFAEEISVLQARTARMRDEMSELREPHHDEYRARLFSILSLHRP